jgi:hypothetical protein
MEVDPEDKNNTSVHVPFPKYTPNSNGQVSTGLKNLGFWRQLVKSAFILAATKPPSRPYTLKQPKNYFIVVLACYSNFFTTQFSNSNLQGAFKRGPRRTIKVCI